MTVVPDIRVGQGFDIHRFSDDPARVLVLGGVQFPGEPGLDGHSDADVVAHACADALLGAAGLGDIGMHFPDTDPRWAGADSIEMLRHVVDVLLAADAWVPVNIDCAVVCERPKLAPRRDEMQSRLTTDRRRARIGQRQPRRAARPDRCRRGHRVLRHGADRP